MKTAEAIEGMTDAGEFEVLATRVLRLQDEDCRLLEHMGVNAEGKTIANPLDGFCQVPGTDPPRFVMTAFTTAKTDSLHDKWLYDHEVAPRAQKATAVDDGDLVKAGRRAASLRKDHPTAKFVVHLCTNRRIDDQLMQDAYKLGNRLGMEARFLAQSRLRDCLDTTREGQWLRKLHLGIQAELLSLPLLISLGRKSLAQYGGEFIITPPHSFVDTASHRALTDSIQTRMKAAHIVVGASGIGKSVTSYQVLRDHVAAGGVGLWIPGETAAAAASLEEAVEAHLRRLLPTLEPGAGSVALSFSSQERPLLLVIDDVNRSGAPSSCIRKMLTWARPLARPKGNDDARRTLSLVIPIWDVFWAPFNSVHRDSPWLGVLPVGQMSEEDAVRCLRATMDAQCEVLSDEDCRHLVKALGYDAILIAMFSTLAQKARIQEALAMAREIMQRFVRSAVEEASATSHWVPAEIDESLRSLAAVLLEHRDLYPRWSDVAQWLPEGQVRIIREMTVIGKLCRVTGLAGEQRFAFRHDRILEHYLVQALTPMLAAPAEHAGVLSDPFFAYYVGRAMAFSPEPQETLTWMRCHAPIVLIECLRFATGNVAAPAIAAAKAWLADASRDRRTPPSILYETYRILGEIDSPVVLDVSESLSRHRLLARARLANGDADAAVVEFSDTRWFAPNVTDRALDRILQRAFNHHRNTLTNRCAAILTSSGLKTEEKIGALILAGFIADPTLAAPIQAAWDAASDKEPLLEAGIWAACRCGAVDPASVLGPMLAIWASLPDEAPQHQMTRRGAVAETLRFAMRRGIADAALDHLIKVARSGESLRWPIAYLLEQVDHPAAIRFLVEETADIERRAKESGGFSFWTHTLRDQWDPTVKNRGHRLSPPSVAVIRDCWESAGADEGVRKTAFRLWLAAVDDLGTLRALASDHFGHADALWRRATLGDMTTVPEVKLLLPSQKNWAHVLDHVWTNEFAPIFDEALTKLGEQTPDDYSGGYSNDHYMYAHLLRDIPVGDAEPLLRKHWPRLKFSRLFVQVALYLGTEISCALASQEFAEYPADVDVFQHVGSFFGFHMTGLEDRLTVAHLNSLAPYFGQVDAMVLTEAAGFCEKHDLRDWSLANVYPELARRGALPQEDPKKQRPSIHDLRRRHFPTDAELMEELAALGPQDQRHGRLWHWCEEFGRRRDDPARWRSVIGQWLWSSPSIERLRIAADVVWQLGTRRDLEILTGHAIASDPVEVAAVIENVQFAVMRRSLK